VANGILSKSSNGFFKNYFCNFFSITIPRQFAVVIHIAGTVHIRTLVVLVYSVFCSIAVFYIATRICCIIGFIRCSIPDCTIGCQYLLLRIESRECRIAGIRPECQSMASIRFFCNLVLNIAGDILVFVAIFLDAAGNISLFDYCFTACVFAVYFSRKRRCR